MSEHDSDLVKLANVIGGCQWETPPDWAIQAARRVREFCTHASFCAECGVILGFRADYCRDCTPAELRKS